MSLIQELQNKNVVEYGVYPDALAEKIESFQNAEAVVAALNNSDVVGPALQLLEKNPQKVFDGMKLLAEEVHAESLVLHIPNYAKDLAEKLSRIADENHVEVRLGIVNKRATANCFVTHIASCADVKDVADGTYKEGCYVSVNGGEFHKVDASVKLCELLGTEVKGVQCGYELLDACALEKTVGEVNPENGVICALTKNDCVVDTVDKWLVNCRVQSCGKCVFCREGLLQLEAMAKDITIGKGRMDELDITREIGEAMTYSTPCSMGQNASRMALTAQEAFAGEYEEHIKKKKCAADVCTAFQKVYVDPTACTGCGKCQEVCPVHAIDGADGYIHIVFDHWCTRCGNCVTACPEGAIHKTTDRVPKLPDRMMRVGRFHK